MEHGLRATRRWSLRERSNSLHARSGHTDNISLQFKDYSVHNKGFVIDSKIAVVSSQNFSQAGVETNRDAGVITESEDIAQYFDAVFLSDFNTRTRPAVAGTVRNAHRPRAATKSALRQKGTRRKAKVNSRS
jgi:phosphatidylserine/phosphatidylglycerophosphate/cardiolipin synthase-like enzyme